MLIEVAQKLAAAVIRIPTSAHLLWSTRLLACARLLSLLLTNLDFQVTSGRGTPWLYFLGAAVELHHPQTSLVTHLQCASPLAASAPFTSVVPEISINALV